MVRCASVCFLPDRLWSSDAVYFSAFQAEEEICPRSPPTLAIVPFLLFLALKEHNALLLCIGRGMRPSILCTTTAKDSGLHLLHLMIHHEYSLKYSCQERPSELVAQQMNNIVNYLGCSVKKGIARSGLILYQTTGPQNQCCLFRPSWHCQVLPGHCQVVGG